LRSERGRGRRRGRGEGEGERERELSGEHQNKTEQREGNLENCLKQNIGHHLVPTV
jgi:hypothetical protein